MKDYEFLAMILVKSGKGIGKKTFGIQKPLFVSLTNAYHEKTIDALSVTEVE